MFPDFQYLFQYLFNIDIPGLSIAKTFGFFVAISFLAAAIVIIKELKRKKDEGLLQGKLEEREIGKPVSTLSLVLTAIVGFIVGYKLVGLIADAATSSADPIAYFASSKGNIIGGIVFAIIAFGIRFSDKKNAEKVTYKKEKVIVYPHERIADILFIAAIAGFAGAKIFNAFETWDSFIQDPIGSLFSGSGLTFYGGLIVATIALYWYSKNKGFSFKHLCDAAAPALILAYGIGRLGCQFSGDGDWGVYNSAYITQADASLGEASPPDSFYRQVAKYPQEFSEFESMENVRHIYYPAPSWMPTWFVAQNFKHNVNNEGMSIEGHQGYYSHVLPVAVFPTAMYETIMCIFIFLILWSIRKKLKFPLQMFGVYLIFNGLERFLIEKIRVNTKIDWFFNFTQAEVISSSLITCGILLLVFNKKINQITDNKI